MKTPTPPNPHYRHRFPAAIVGHALCLYHVFSRSLRDVELIPAARRTRVFQPIDSAEAVFGAIDGPEIRFHSALPVSICLLSRLGFGVKTPFALPQAGRRTNIRFIFQAMVTRLHSPRTRSIPRSGNWWNPNTDLMMPNTGSGICLRSA
jgi:hypothetical protein